MSIIVEPTVPQIVAEPKEDNFYTILVQGVGLQGPPGTTLHAELTDISTSGHPDSAITTGGHTGNLAGASTAGEAFNLLDGAELGAGWTDTGAGYLTPATSTNGIQMFEEIVFSGGNQIRNGAFSNMTFELRGKTYRFDSNGFSCVDDAMLGTVSPWTRIYGDTLWIGSAYDATTVAKITGAGNTSATYTVKFQNSDKLDPTLGIRDDRTLWTNGEQGATGTIDLTTVTQITVTNGIITGWS